MINIDSPYPILDWRNQEEDWSMTEELEKRGYENARNSLLILNRTFLDDTCYNNKLQEFIEWVENYELHESYEPFKIIITDHSFHFQVLIRR